MPEEKDAQKTEDSPKQQSPQNTEDAKNKQEKPQEAAASPKKSGKLMPYLIPAAVLIVMVIAGFILGLILSSSEPKTAKAASEKPDENQAENLLTETKADAKGWYYDLDPIATNLNEPGATRYVRVLLTLELSPQVNQAKGSQFLNERKPIMINLMNIYFAGLSISDLNSDKNIRRIQSELVDIFNENLYPNAKPLIKKILFKEFGIQ